jgi:hypothetical protein
MDGMVVGEFQQMVSWAMVPVRRRRSCGRTWRRGEVETALCVRPNGTQKNGSLNTGLLWPVMELVWEVSLYLLVLIRNDGHRMARRLSI